MLLFLMMARYTVIHLGISVSPKHLTKHIQIMITRKSEYTYKKSNENIMRIMAIVIEVLDHTDISPGVVIDIV